MQTQFVVTWGILLITSCRSSFQLRNATIVGTQFSSHIVEQYDCSWRNLNESACGYGSYSFSTLYPFLNSELIVLNNFSFDIPSQATVTAIRQYWIVGENPDVVPRIHESEVILIKNASRYNSTRFFTEMPTFTSQDGWQTFATTIEYPLSGNNLLWNTTWDPSEINSDLFGVGLRVINPSGTNTFARISCVYIEVEFLAQSSESTRSELTSRGSTSNGPSSSGVTRSDLSSIETSSGSSTAISTPIVSSSPISTDPFETTDVIKSSGESDIMINKVTLIIISICLGCLFLIALGGYFVDKVVKKRKLKQKQDMLIPFETNDLFLKNVVISEKIGEGNFGEVYKGKMNDNTLTVACKVLKNETILNNFEQNREASILSKLNHDHILRFYGIYNADTHMYLVTEYVRMGSLHDFLRKGMLSDFSHREKLTLILTIASGMHYLQTEGIIHGDLRAQNLLITKIDDELSIKISDFGLAKHINQFYTGEDEKFIPIKWTAPEVITKKKFSTHSDIWSFGVVIWEISHEGELPYKNIKNKDLITELMGGYRLDLEDRDISRRLRRLVEKCWNIVPHERPKFVQAFREIDTVISQSPTTELSVKVYVPLPIFGKNDSDVYNNVKIYDPLAIIGKNDPDVYNNE